MVDLPEILNEDKQEVIHLHGNVEPYTSMIVTKEDYDEFYKEEKTVHFLNGVMSNKTLLFIGFSFKDEYFKNLYKKVYSQIKGEHFIIVPNIHSFDADELLENDLFPIGVKVDDVEKNDFVKAIKTILKELQ